MAVCSSIFIILTSNQFWHVNTDEEGPVDGEEDVNEGEDEEEEDEEESKQQYL